MKIFIAFILLLVFLASQYARHISYLECRLNNYFNVKNEKCDCEKIISKTSLTDVPVAPINHRHIYFEDSFFTDHPGEISGKRYCMRSIFIFTNTEALSEGIAGNLYRPPQAV